jgi:hypothetical protein
MEKLQLRAVLISEVNSCPCKRLDPEHYLPIHRTWECIYASKLRTKGSIVRAWLDSKITTDQFLLATQYVKITKKEVVTLDVSDIKNDILDIRIFAADIFPSSSFH